MKDKRKTWSNYSVLIVLFAIAVAAGTRGLAQQETRGGNKLLTTVTASGLCSRPGPSGPLRCGAFLAKPTTSGVVYASLISFTDRPVGAVFNLKQQVGPLDDSFDDCLTGKTSCTVISKVDPRWLEVSRECKFAFSVRLARYTPPKRAQLQKLICGI